MRAIAIVFLGCVLVLPACTKSGEQAGIEEAQKAAEKEQKEKAAATGGAAKKMNPPVPGRAKLPCTQVIDLEKFNQIVGEPEAMTVVESKTEAEAAASCSLLRGGKRPTMAEQEGIKKKNGGRVGVLPGDELCNVSLFCWTIEDGDRFKKKCTDEKKTIDDSLGFPACVMIVATGEDDVKNFRFFDEDTKCIIGVRAGPSNVDNVLIGKCAKAAHDLIGPTQIAVGAAPAAPAGPAGSAK